MSKVLIGKENYLFLVNDSSKELEVHCNNLCFCSNSELQKRYNFENFLIIIFPDKSIYYKNKLPNEYNAQFRPAFEIYKNFFNNKLIDSLDFLKNEEDCYYKTDTHINFKGNYIVYCETIKRINKIFNLDLKINIINIEKMENVILKNLNYGIGDLTWDMNAKDLNLPIIYDNYYYSKDIPNFYNIYKININDNYQFYDYELNNVTNKLENQLLNWCIISDYIINYKEKDLQENEPVFLIFHDSFLLSAYQLYFFSFKNAYYVKSVYDEKIINLIKPNYVFEFRVERFLF